MVCICRCSCSAKTRLLSDTIIQGLAEPLFEKLTASPAEPYLKALQELYINFWGECYVGGSGVNDELT